MQINSYLPGSVWKARLDKPNGPVSIVAIVKTDNNISVRFAPYYEKERIFTISLDKAEAKELINQLVKTL